MGQICIVGLLVIDGNWYHATLICSPQSTFQPSSKPNSEPPVVDGGLIAAIARIELEISSLDKQRQALKLAVEILRQRSGATPALFLGLWYPNSHSISTWKSRTCDLKTNVIRYAQT